MDAAAKTTAEDSFLKPREVEAEFKLSENWLAKSRVTGTGPSFVKVARRVIRYRRDAVEKFMRDREVPSTAHAYAADIATPEPERLEKARRTRATRRTRS